RHESLRTRFGTSGSQPVQIVDPPFPRVLPLVDLEALPADARPAVAQELATAEAIRPFDLGRGPLFRVLLIRLASERHLVELTMHHIVSDAWSIGVLVRDIGLLYGALTAGRTPELPALPVQYSDFAVWKRRWLSGEALAGQLAWWRERLAGVPPLLALPTDRPRPPVQGTRGRPGSAEAPAALAGRPAP